MKTNMYLLSLLFFISCATICYAQEKKGILKTDIGPLIDNGIFQLSYEFEIRKKSSLEASIAYGYAEEVHLAVLGLQQRYYPFDHEKIAPEGFYLGPAAYLVYANSETFEFFSDQRISEFGVELHALLGYQLLLTNRLSIDPHFGVGFAAISGETHIDFVWGLSLGIAFD